MKNYFEKTIISVSVASLLLVGAVQLNAQKGEFGLRFMPTFSSFDMKTSAGGTVKGEVTLGLGVGALLGFNFTKHVGVQGELIYSTLSQKYKEENVERKVNLRYFNVPIMLSLNTGKTQVVNFNVVGGPQLGISAGSDVFTTGNNGDTPNAVLSVKKGDLGFAYGAGIDFSLNPARTFRLGLGYRGVLGLFDVSDTSNTITTDSYYIIERTHVNTNAAYIGVSLLF